MNDQKLLSKKFVFFLAGIFVFMIIIGFSYAYWRKNIVQTNPNTITTLNCLNVSITDNNSAISLTDEYAIPNSEGMAKTPYTFTLTNTCSQGYLLTNISLDVLSTTTIDASHMRVSLNNTVITTDTSVILNTLTTGTAVNTGATNYILKTDVILAPNETETYDLRVWIDEGTTATDGMNKEFHAKVVTTYKLLSNPSNNAETFAYSNSGIRTANGGMERIEQAATTQLRKAAEYRYYGQNPNNYVTFNDETWRIIGVFETENSSGSIAYRVKLIRNDTLGYYSYDSSASTVNSGNGINEWSQADLMKLLNPGYESNTDLNSSGTSITVNNSLYWNKGSGTCYIGQSNATTTCNFTSTGLGTTAEGLIDTVKYYTAGTNSYGTSQQYYTYERGSAVGSRGTGDTVTRTTSWIGKIGLMYVSDYGYAADPSTCARTNKLNPDYYNTTPTCHTNNWLWKSNNEWTIVPNSSSSSYVWDLGSSGSVYYDSAHYGSAWHPVLYLKPSTTISSGTGTSADPYILS